jgi:hypothetical protein
MGAAKLASSFSSKNIGLNIGGTNAPTTRIRDIGSAPTTVKNMPDWVGFVIAAIGLATALLRLFNS